MTTYTGVTNFQKSLPFWPTLYMSKRSDRVVSQVFSNFQSEDSVLKYVQSFK